MATAKAKVSVIKKTENLENRVKALTELQNKIDKQNLLLKALGTEYDALERILFDEMQGQGLKTISTTKATAYIQARQFVSFEKRDDAWDDFLDWAVKHKAFDLLQRRVNQRSYLDRTLEGQKIPGVTSVEIPQLHLRRK